MATTNTFTSFSADNVSAPSSIIEASKKAAEKAVEKVKDLFDAPQPAQALTEITTEVVAAVVTPVLEKASALGLLKFCRSCKNHRAADRMSTCASCCVDYCDWCVAYDDEQCMCTRDTAA